MIKGNTSNNYSSSEESGESMKDNKKVNKLGKSEQKNKIVRNIFLNVSKVDNGAKGKGQVLIVGHSEDSLKSSVSRDSYQVPNIYDNRFSTPMPIICRIDLSRLSRIPTERNCNMNNNIEKSPQNIHSMVNVFDHIAKNIHISFKQMTYISEWKTSHSKWKNNSS